MIYMIFWSLFFVLATSVCEFGYAYGGIDRTFKGLNKGAAEASLNMANLDASGMPQFQVALFESNVRKYLVFNLKPYVKETAYLVGFSYYDVGTGRYFEKTPAFSTGAKVTLKASVLSFSVYEDSVRFYVRKGTAYE
jgi:hypothetical protein